MWGQIREDTGAQPKKINRRVSGEKFFEKSHFVIENTRFCAIIEGSYTRGIEVMAFVCN